MKNATTNGKRKKRNLSDVARERIALAQKRRWEAWRRSKGASTPAPTPASSEKKKRGRPKLNRPATPIQMAESGMTVSKIRYDTKTVTLVREDASGAKPSEPSTVAAVSNLIDSALTLGAETVSVKCNGVLYEFVTGFKSADQASQAGGDSMLR